jgi:hypothetical protein
MDDLYFEQTIGMLKGFDEVDAIVLGGSRVSGHFDSGSDYDVWVYLNNNLSIDKRKNILSQTCSHMDFGRTVWGAYWDDCVLNSGIPIEINYDSIDSKKKSLSNTLEKHNSWGAGYTTCFCYNVFCSNILYDPKGVYGDMVKQFTMPYPEQLRKNIIAKNRECMGGKTSVSASYINQIEKAVMRNDMVSVNHRIAEFVKSYFDILFALNRKFHPGEKHLVEYAKELCEWLPEDFETDLHTLLVSNGNDETIPVLRKMIINLDLLIKNRN